MHYNLSAQIVKIWCVISNQNGSILSLGNSNEQSMKSWNIPCGTFIQKDATLPAAIRRIVCEASGFNNILHRMCTTKIVINKGTLELHMWFICIPIDEVIVKKEVSKWVKVDSIPDGTIPPDLMRSLNTI